MSRPQSHRTAILPLILLLLSVPGFAATDGEELLARSIAYHDQDGLWGTRALTLSFAERRPDGSKRQTRITLDPRRQRFAWWSQRGEHVLEGSVVKGRCSIALDGSATISDDDHKTHQLDCDRVALYRDYYTYLWGLPMKLRDPGTRLDPAIGKAVFDRGPVLSLRVTYDPEVGNDTWYFYFDPDSAALVGYRFFHNESANDGEYILPEGEVSGEGLRLPRTRTWYTNAEDRLLGTDTLTGLEVGEE
jgi:hypothetical protein